MDQFWHSFGQQLLATALGGTVPIMLYILAGRRTAKKDIEARHAENKNLLEEWKKIKPHFHSHREAEVAGARRPLTTDGVIPRGS